jgi:hypothetical protein
MMKTCAAIRFFRQTQKQFGGDHEKQEVCVSYIRRTGANHRVLLIDYGAN